MPISKINTTSITDNSVTAGKIVAGAVDADIAAGSIDTAQIADDAVTTAKIPNDAVTADKLANAINTSIDAKLPLSGGTITGNVGVGVTPTDFQNRKSLDIGLGGKVWGLTTATETGHGNNFYFDGAYKRIAASAATRHIQDGNGHTFDVVPSGSANSTISWNTATLISPDGYVTKPNQPCFSATATTTNIPLTTSTTVTLSAERFDVGGNLANNIFTAPVTGKYLFTYIYYVTNLDNGHTTFDCHILTSNKQYQQTMRPTAFMTHDGNFGVSGSVIADMDINDTCRYTVYVSGGSAQTDIHGDSHVSGALLF